MRKKSGGKVCVLEKKKSDIAKELKVKWVD